MRGEPKLRLWAAQGCGLRALSLAREFSFAFAGEGSLEEVAEAQVLWYDGDGLSLRQVGSRLGPVRCDFVAGSARHRRLYGGGTSQALAKAVGIKGAVRPKVADLTAGLGKDAFVLAGLGCSLILVERQPLVAALLKDGLERARLEGASDTELATAIARMTLVHGDALDWLQSLPPDQYPDVIYLDPMFPERRKSAQVNKDMQVLQLLLSKDRDTEGLLALALARARFRVVVKRPRTAPWLEDQKPGISLEGKSVRYDIYPLKKMT